MCVGVGVCACVCAACVNARRIILELVRLSFSIKQKNKKKISVRYRFSYLGFSIGFRYYSVLLGLLVFSTFFIFLGMSSNRDGVLGRETFALLGNILSSDEGEGDEEGEGLTDDYSLLGGEMVESHEGQFVVAEGGALVPFGSSAEGDAVDDCKMVLLSWELKPETVNTLIGKP